MNSSKLSGCTLRTQAMIHERRTIVTSHGVRSVFKARQNPDLVQKHDRKQHSVVSCSKLFLDLHRDRKCVCSFCSRFTKAMIASPTVQKGGRFMNIVTELVCFIIQTKRQEVGSRCDCDQQLLQSLRLQNVGNICSF